MNINPYLLRIPSKSSKTAKVEIFSLNDDNLGTYDLVLNLKSRDEEIKKDYVYKVTVLPFTGDEVIAQLIVPNRIDPRVGGEVRVKLENVRKNDFENIRVSVKSEDIFSETKFVDCRSDISLQAK